MSRLLVNPFDFELAAGRNLAFLLLLVAAILSPNITMPGGLPAIRIEQILLAGYLPLLGLHYWNHRELWRVGTIDVAFMALAVAMAVTLVLAPAFLSAVSWSVRDPFELARVAEYWFLFRLGLSLEPKRGLTDALVVLPTLGALLGLLALVQYLDPGGFNGAVTSIWTVSHNLDGVERAGRTVGTIGNANYFGAFSGLLLIAALSVITLQRPSGWTFAGLAAAVLLTTFSVVSAQSRTAVLALLLSLAVGLALVVIKERGRAAYLPAIGLFVVAATISIAFVELRPPDVGSFHARFAPAGLVGDSSLTIRLSRWKTIFAGFLEGGPSFCEGERLENRRIGQGHEPANGTGWPAADEAAIERDGQRKKDIADIGRAVLDYYCDEDAWPVDVSLTTALVPEHLDSLPMDPSTGEPYAAYVSRAGFLVAAELENAADAEGPVYALGTIPNIAGNPSFESGNPPSRWNITGDATVLRNGQALFGNHSAEVTAEGGGGYFDTIVFDFARDEAYSAAVHVLPLGDEPVTVQLYLAGTMADGRPEDPLAQTVTTVDPGGWRQVVLPFETPEEGRLTVLQVIVRVPEGGGPAAFALDGATLTQGTIAPGFPRITDTDPSRLRNDELPRFADSPIIGAGPRKDIELGNVDNEYALFLDRYGLLGTAAYLALFTSALWLAWNAWSKGTGIVATAGLVMVIFTVLLALFNVTAGSYYHFQIMAVYWLLAGVLAAGTDYGRWRWSRNA